jgi:predicted dehydrogenase
VKRFGLGIIGCGNISDIYFKNCKNHSNLNLLACADIISDRARDKAQQHGIANAWTVEELLASPEIDIVLNLTIPKAHEEVNLAALEAGKHVYAEKPLGINRIEGRRVLDKAREKGLLVGCAPDTFLGAGLQTCRKLIDDGAIGKPTSATAFMACHGHESWHPAPEFYYEPGGGPMLDMGPYYVTALVSLIGAGKRVAGMVSRALDERTMTSEARFGSPLPVLTDTHIAGLIEFEQGAVATIITSFDIWASNLPLLEIHGTEGSLSVPDPNGFGGPVKLFSGKTGKWEDVTLTHGYAENSRGLGVSDLAAAVEEGRKPRASGELAYHVLDIMESFYDSSDSGRFVDLQSRVDRSEPMPA